MVIQQRIRAENLKKIYQLVNQNRSISRAALSKETNLSKPTVSSLVDELIVNKYLIDCGTVASQQMGRRPNELRVEWYRKPSGGYQLAESALGYCPDHGG